MSEPLTITVREGSDFIELCDLLKNVGLSESGGSAKQSIAAGEVTVDGVVETRKRRKVRPGQVVEFEGQKVNVAQGAAEGGADGGGEVS